MIKKDFRLIDFITFKKSEAFLLGNFKSSFLGTGIDFDELKIYNFGDNVKDIDWLTSAKEDKIYLKKYKEEREVPIVFIFDLNSSMNFFMNSRSKIETLNLTFNILGFSAFKTSNPFSGIFITDKKIEELEIKKGFINFIGISKKINNPENYYSTQININKAFDYIFNKKIKNKLIFYFTDSLEFNIDTKITAISKLNDFIFVNISDEFENTLNSNLLANFVNNSNFLTINLNNETKRLQYSNARNIQFENIKKNIGKIGGSFLGLDNNSNPYKELFNFFKSRQKQK